MMSERLQKHAVDLHYLLRAKPTVCKVIIAHYDKELILCICECVHNILNGTVPLEKKERATLIKHKHNLRKLIKEETPLKEKKKIIQKGGFLGALAPVVLPLLSSLLLK